MNKGSINGYIIENLIDNGSVVNIIEEKLFEKVKKQQNKVSVTKLNLIASGSSSLGVIGETSKTTMVDDQPFDSSIITARNMIEPVILGVEFLKQYKGILYDERQQIFFQQVHSIFTATKQNLVLMIRAIKQVDCPQIYNSKHNKQYTENMAKEVYFSTSEEKDDEESSLINATTTFAVSNKTTDEGSSEVQLSIACKLVTNHEYIFCPDNYILQL